MVLRIFFIIFCLLLPFLVYGNVSINEIAWMGTSVSYNDEWIELYNNGSTVSLDGWILKADDGSLEINLSGTISAKGFYLLERTNDDTVPRISADLIYKGTLSNNGENLKLYNNSGSLVDQVNSSDEWLAGDNSTKQTMERIGSNWQTSQDPGGTPKTINSIEVPKPEVQEQETKLLEPEFESIIIEPEKSDEVGPRRIYFNEVLPSPDGPDAENEWIEIYNQNDFEVNLSGWTIQDTAGKTTIYTINKKIPALGYLVFLRPETKITLNNDGDGLSLINPKGEIIDSISFGKASLGQSYNRTESGWAWTKNLTPGSKNIIPKPSSQNQGAKLLENEQNKQAQNQGAKLLDFGDKSETINLRSLAPENRTSVFAIAFIIALLCSISFLIIKNNLKAFWY